MTMTPTRAAPTVPTRTPTRPAAATTGPSTVGTILLTGLVLTAPACPGPQQLGSACPPRALAGAEVAASVDGTVLATVSTSTSGRFTLNLPPGSYVITAYGIGGLHARASIEVHLVAPRDVTLTVDSGMR